MHKDGFYLLSMKQDEIGFYSLSKNCFPFFSWEDGQTCFHFECTSQMVELKKTEVDQKPRKKNPSNDTKPHDSHLLCIRTCTSSCTSLHEEVSVEIGCFNGLCCCKPTKTWAAVCAQRRVLIGLWHHPIHCPIFVYQNYYLMYVKVWNCFMA